ncbi:uncharacterized protein LOC142164561 [Nicotiana tabacum]|uniref:Uncharacterized protein LOC142164561 n=1 Tax=Nicotiana tabacum TaxID=4097 RepID=A0AC58S0V3_TOBAC
MKLPHAYKTISVIDVVDEVEDDVKVKMEEECLDHCLGNLRKVLKRCEETNLVLNWKKCHLMVDEGIVLGHKNSKQGIEVYRAKNEIISKLPPPISNAKFEFYEKFLKAFEELKASLTTSPIIVTPDWSLPFELMCDAIGVAIGVVLGQ